jgi:hypothetical protein
MLGLALEGIDQITMASTSPRLPCRTYVGGLRKVFQLGDDDEMWMWTDIQKHIASRSNKLTVEGLDEFFTWFQGASLERFREKFERSISKPFYRFMLNRPEPIGRWFRKTAGGPIISLENSVRKRCRTLHRREGLATLLREVKKRIANFDGPTWVLAGNREDELTKRCMELIPDSGTATFKFSEHYP